MDKDKIIDDFTVKSDDNEVKTVKHEDKVVNSNNKFCSNCGELIDEKAEICPKCGVRVSAPPISPRNAALSALLSFFFPGAGQIYNGETSKGICLLIIYFGCLCFFFLVVTLIVAFVIWLYAIFDAYNTSNKINNGESY